MFKNQGSPQPITVGMCINRQPAPQPAPVAEAAPAPTPQPVTPPEKQEEVAAAVAATAPAEGGAKPSAQDILAAIRNRSN